MTAVQLSQSRKCAHTFELLIHFLTISYSQNELEDFTHPNSSLRLFLAQQENRLEYKSAAEVMKIYFCNSPIH